MHATVRRVLSVVVGLLVGVVALSVLLALVGVGEVLAALRSATPALVGAALLVALCWMAAWSCTLHLVFGVLGVPTSPGRSFLVFLTVLCANNVAPFSVGGGEPIAALFVSRSTGTSYETGLLSVVSTDVLNYLPAPVLAGLGLLYVGSTTVLGREQAVVVATLLAISLALVSIGLLAWHFRGWLELRAVTVLVALQGVTARAAPRDWLPSPRGVQTRIGAFVDGLERVAADRRVLLLGVGASALGWLLQATVLWLSLSAVGAPVAPVVPVLVVSLVTVTDLVPVPGGVGSVDAALVGVLVALAGVPAGTAAAGALVFRSATLLFSILLGSVTLGVLQVTRPSTA